MRRPRVLQLTRTRAPKRTVTAGLAICASREAQRALLTPADTRWPLPADDTMQYVSAPVKTLCMGQASSMASLLLSAGAPGERRILPNARVMLHQPSGGAGGQASDIAIHAAEILKTRSRLNELYVKHTGQALKQIETTMERDFFFSAAEAKAFGLVDEVVERRPRAAV